jgi:hypothetical protein
MPEKKPYTPPQVFEITLDQEQAILSACSLMTMSASQGGSGGCRPDIAGGCKRRNRVTNTDFGPRPS